MPKRKKAKGAGGLSVRAIAALCVVAAAVVLSIMMPVNDGEGDGGNPRLLGGDKQLFEGLPRENRCEACKFVVDHSMLAIERAIVKEKERQGAKSWGDLKMRMYPIPVLRGMCSESSINNTLAHYVSALDRSWTEESPHGNTTTQDTLAGCRVAVNTKPVFDALLAIYSDMGDFGMPLSYIAESMPDKRIPKGNLKLKVEQHYKPICEKAWGVCNASESEPRMVMKNRAPMPSKL